MAMHNPPHPGEFIIQVYLELNNLSGRELAGKLGVAASTPNRVLTGTSRISQPLMTATMMIYTYIFNRGSAGICSPPACASHADRQDRMRIHGKNRVRPIRIRTHYN